MKRLIGVFPVILLVVTIMLTGCSGSKKTTAVSAPGTVNDSLPPLAISEIDIPIKIYTRPLLTKAETLVPKEFTSEKWPDYTQSSCDFRYKYRFVRSGL